MFPVCTKMFLMEIVIHQLQSISHVSHRSFRYGLAVSTLKDVSIRVEP